MVSSIYCCYVYEDWSLFFLNLEFNLDFYGLLFLEISNNFDLELDLEIK